MGVDAEIANIYEGIYNINSTLFTMNQGLSGLMDNLDSALTTFDRTVNMVVSKVNSVQRDIVQTSDKFPGEWLYLLILLIVIFVIDVIGVYLALHIYRFFSNRNAAFDRQRDWYNKNVFRRAESRVYRWESRNEGRHFELRLYTGFKLDAMIHAHPPHFFRTQTEKETERTTWKTSKLRRRRTPSTLKQPIFMLSTTKMMSRVSFLLVLLFLGVLRAQLGMLNPYGVGYGMGGIGGYSGYGLGMGQFDMYNPYGYSDYWRCRNLMGGYGAYNPTFLGRK
ncbi:unnamed protein product [Caenorhabditis auriculariae]|uniref:Uncharacterized protein n=1 Tax=Caenorhabditis auriculariae TaxID=2777116 RepID=A0A8S1HWU1_9PELO|nr:unnamed protein product [Caenorhabditis auriculariae]